MSSNPTEQQLADAWERALEEKAALQQAPRLERLARLRANVAWANEHAAEIDELRYRFAGHVLTGMDALIAMRQEVVRLQGELDDAAPRLLRRAVRRHNARVAARPRSVVRRVAHGARQQSGRPRAAAHRSSSASGDSGDEEPAPAPSRVARAAGVALSKLRICRTCGVFAYAIDDYQRAALDAVGFTTTCPTCRVVRA